jgi:transketolase
LILDKTAPPTTMRDLRQNILLAASAAKEGHIASAFSVLDIIWVLYDEILRYDCRDPQLESRDRFLLSKGHASLALYAVLAAKGFFSQELLSHFAEYHSILGGHPDRTKVPGVEASTGSLGHGLPMAVGVAMGLKIKESRARVFCLVGDGECNEGSIWEACLLAVHHRLNRLCCIVDYNHSTDRALGLGDLERKFESLGFACVSVDGHSHGELTRALSVVSDDRPSMIVANTVKGRGCGRMENNPEWHHRAPNQSELALLLEDLS